MWVIVWLCLVIIFVIIEAMTLDLTSIWFGIGAVFAMIVALLTDNFLPPLVIFILVSFICLIAFKPIAKKYIFQERIKTNIDRVIDMQGIATTDINSVNGEVKVDGKIWSARSDVVILKNQKIKVLEIQGVKLIVQEV